MPYSNCCGAYTDIDEIGICPDCLEHCSWEDEEELEQDRQNEIELEQEQINKNETNGK